MKTLFTLSIAVFFISSLFAQTRTSIANGDWFSPTTWGASPPIPGYTVIINHNVTLSSDWGYSSGSITVNAGGSLTQSGGLRALGQSGGSFSNAGTVTFSKMAFWAGTLSNSGTLNSNDSLYVAINLNNTGTVQSANLYNSASLTNNGYINGTNFFNNGTLQNNVQIDFIHHYNNSISYNDGYMSFNDYTNAGTFYNNAFKQLSIFFDCTNGDTVNHDAHWYNNGITLISHDFTNIDILDANDANNIFCVFNNSSNQGTVTGVIDFCNALSGGSFGINTGTIGPGVVYCINSGGCFGSIKDNSVSIINIFPNPVKESFIINLNNNKIEKIEIIDILGKVVYSQKVNSNDEVTILRNNIPSGLYILKANTVENSYSSKIIFE